MVLFNQSHGSTPMISMNSSKTDLSDVGLCSLNIHETNYNLLLCYLMKKEYDKAFEKVNELVHAVPKKYLSCFNLVRGVLMDFMNAPDKA